MVRSEQKQGPTTPRRTPGALKCRQNLADAAVGVMPREGDTATAAPKIKRFRVLVYLCGAPNANIGEPRRECHEYADAFGWEIAGEFEDHEGLSHPGGRTGLTQAMERIKNNEADAVLTPWRSMISPVPQEYNEIARKVEKNGGFLHVIDSHRAQANSAQ
ncbi:recombinase family protein [Streptomyces bluensis]|uniref:recombinase family protein n=1 Tax=Streptomyces bluensis TaxID=33897 RepID=UPI003679B921